MVKQSAPKEELVLLDMKEILRRHAACRSQVEAILRKMLDEFTKAWSRGDIEVACECYGEAAIYISRSGGIVMEGKKYIIDRYHETYPDAATRGVLKLDIIDFQMGLFFKDDLPTTVTTNLRWTISREGEEDKIGPCLEVYQMDENGKYYVVLDAS